MFMPKRKSKTSIYIPLIVLVIIISFLSGYYFPKNITCEKISKSISLQPSEEFIEVKPSLVSNELSLYSDCYVLSFRITQDQAYSIRNGLENNINLRPMTHDLIKDVFENYGIHVLYAQIDRVKDDIYYATIFMQENGSVLELDSRPSDAVAISVRTKTPFYIKKSILEEYGEKVC